MRKNLAALIAASIGCLVGTSMADVKLPAIIGDNMALQANKPLPIWGTADAGEKVTATLGSETLTATADKDGKWMVKFKPLSSGENLTLSVAGKNKIEVKNIIVGSVWICSGQSNMEFTLRSAHNAETEIPKANYPKIRLFTVTKNVSFTPLTDVKGQWVECKPDTARNFSAVGYFFGRELHENTGSPVGLIHTSWGGTPAQSWTSIEKLDANPELKEAYSDKTRNNIANLPALKEKYAKDLAEYQAKMKEWKETIGVKYDAAMKQWNEDAKKAKEQGKSEPARPQPEKPAPRGPTDPERNANNATVLYNAMIAPLIPYAIEGATWYQGESNASVDGARIYNTLFPAMITDWRTRWGEGDFPFLFVQLANFMKRDDVPTDNGWPRLREAQLNTLKLPNTGMAVIIDIGQENDIHPRDKMDVGHRLALWAEKMVFGKSVVYSGPLYDAMKVEGNKIRVSFKSVGSGLTIAAAPSTQPSVEPEKPLSEIKGFAIAGADKKWVWANAKIDGDSVVVWSDNVKDPVAVRYAWGNNPVCNLYNKEGLPASPFRTDNWNFAAKPQ